MKKLLSMLSVLGLTITGATSVVACGTTDQVDKAVDLSKIAFQEYTNLVNDNKNIDNQDVPIAIENVQTEILNQLHKNTETKNVTEMDFTTNAADVIIEGDLWDGVTVEITATPTSQYLTGKANIEIIFGSFLELDTLENNSIEYQTSGIAITEVEAKYKWFNNNFETLNAANKNVNIDWFETSNFEPGDKDHPGNIDVSPKSEQNKEFLNISKNSIKTTIKQSGTIDTSVGGGTGIIENKSFDANITSITQLANGTILASTTSSIYKLTAEGTIDKKIETIDSIFQIFQLANGTILAGIGNSIYELTDEGKIDTSVGNGTGILENKTFDSTIVSITQLANGTILVGTNLNSIYKLTDEGKIDHSVGTNGNGKLEDKTLDGVVYSITQLANGTILVGTSTGSIYKLTDEGKIDHSVGTNGNGKLEDKTLDGVVYSITQLANGTILAGTTFGQQNSDNFGSIYKLTDEGKIDTTVGSGSNGKIENGTIDLGARAITQLANGTILAGTSSIWTNKIGSIYKLVN
ncbi:lipoprotein [Spiroplasma endosymbiont of Labia minor]|uniref:lipoprotein n=1 Tax=Spiroplasma endosymbiont of Labia minor TaxID=3066305 RepID=UPI0030CD8C94